MDGKKRESREERLAIASQWLVGSHASKNTHVDNGFSDKTSNTRCCDILQPHFDFLSL